MKKSTKRTNTKVGKNVFGETCIVKEIEIQKETALEQFMKIIKDIEAYSDRDERLEYTVTYAKDMEQKEIMELDETFAKITALRALSRGAGFGKVDLGKTPLPRVA